MDNVSGNFPASNADTSAKPAVTRPEPSMNKATCGRLLHIYSSAGVCPRPGLAIEEIEGEVSVFIPAPSSQHVKLYDPLTVEQRELLAADGEPWAEWMPYQAGQAQKTQQVESDLAGRVKDLTATFTAHFSEVDTRISTMSTALSSRASQTLLDDTRAGLAGAEAKLASNAELIQTQNETIAQLRKELGVLKSAVGELVKQTGSSLQPTASAPPSPGPGNSV